MSEHQNLYAYWHGFALESGGSDSISISTPIKYRMYDVHAVMLENIHDDHDGGSSGGGDGGDGAGGSGMVGQKYILVKFITQFVC